VLVLLESMLAAIDAELRIERASTAPVTLTAEHVLRGRARPWHLVPVDTPDVARTDLAHRDHRPELLDESALVDGTTTYHAVLL
jgi:hypothetical protein